MPERQVIASLSSSKPPQEVELKSETIILPGSKDWKDEITKSPAYKHLLDQIEKSKSSTCSSSAVATVAEAAAAAGRATAETFASLYLNRPEPTKSTSTMAKKIPSPTVPSTPAVDPTTGAIRAAAAAVSAAPSWVSTTLAWLKQEHPHWATSLKRTPEAKLQQCLSRMGWQLATYESVGGGRGSDYEAMLQRAVEGWDQTKHDHVRTFLLDGGLDGDRKKLGVPAGGPAAAVPSPDDTEVEQVVKDLRPKQQMSTEHEIEALIELEEFDSNPRTGSW